MPMSPVTTKLHKLAAPHATPKLPLAEFSVFEARPEKDEDIRGGIVLIQEIFGVNPHIRALASRYAERGFLVWAPAYFDHIEKNIELDYTPEGIERGRNLVTKLGWEQAIEDTKLTAGELRLRLPDPAKQKIATIGFCWGGSLAWLSSTRLKHVIDASVCYYGRAIWEFRNEKPQVPVILHYGESDPSIPMTQVNEVKATHPTVPVHVFKAGHGFHCDARKDFNPVAAAHADRITMEFLKPIFGA